MIEAGQLVRLVILDETLYSLLRRLPLWARSGL